MARKILNISLPAELGIEVDEAVKSGQYASRSEFFRHLMRIWKEELFLQELRESQKEIVRGKGKRLRSLKDLR